MKKSTKMISTIAVVGLLLAGCAANAAQVGRIGREAAKDAAIAAAGLDNSEVLVTSLERDWRNGIEYYEVDFVADGIKYEYDIDALTGKVIASEIEKEREKSPAQATPEAVVPETSEEVAPVQTTPAAAKGNGLTEEEAKKIALAQVPGADESHIYKFGIDYDDGKLEYEGSIIFEEMEYEFEIDGHSGAIRDWEAESIYD